MKPTLIIVGADKGGVGKTTVTRILLDYLKAKGAKPTVYDTEGALHKFFSYANVIDITNSGDQSKVFDGVKDAGITVVDMKAGTLSDTLELMRNAGKLDASDKGEERYIIFHVLGSNTQSLDEVKKVHQYLSENAEHVLIENHSGRDGTFFKWDDARRKEFFENVLSDSSKSIVIPHLDTQTSEDIDLKKQSFAGYIENKDKGNKDWWTRMANHWRGIVFVELDNLKLLQS